MGGLKQQTVNLPLSYCSAAALRKLRQKKGMNQSEFWGQIGVTQSGGSRYENGRHVPPIVAMAVELAHGPKATAEHLLVVLRREQAV